MLFWNHLGISFPLSTGSTGKTNFWVLWAGPDLTLTFMILTWPSPGTWTSRTPCISWYKSNYSNILHYSNIRSLVSQKTNIIRYSYSSNFDFRILFVIRIRPIFIIRCNTDLYYNDKVIVFIGIMQIMDWILDLMQILSIGNGADNEILWVAIPPPYNFKAWRSALVE